MRRAWTASVVVRTQTCRGAGGSAALCSWSAGVFIVDPCVSAAERDPIAARCVRQPDRGQKRRQRLIRAGNVGQHLIMQRIPAGVEIGRPSQSANSDVETEQVELAASR